MTKGTFVLEVTDEDIDEGEGVKAERCAIARAGARLRGRPHVAVCQTDLTIGKRAWFGPDMPDGMAVFVTSFDQYKLGRGPRPAPRSFVVDCAKGRVAK